MAVYVDPCTRKQGPYTLATLIADSDKELHAIADAIGLDPSWILQREGSTDTRAFVSPGLRARAIKRKAIEISTEECQAMRWHRHHHGALGTPAAALERFTREPRTTTNDTERGTP